VQGLAAVEVRFMGHKYLVEWSKGWVAALACGIASTAAQESPFSAEELYQRVAPSVWLVQVRNATGNALGSAVVIGSGTLITNCHVVDKARTIAVRHGSKQHEVQLQYRDPTRDLCQLSVPA
jgi:S1-C subfamily serine protease